MEKKERLVWIDNVKAFAIVLVVLGHLSQSFVKGGFANDGFAYSAFNQIIYSFHVPLFFVCSGFLYQHLTKKQNFKAYSKGVLKKLIAYGVPYFVFSIATIVLKLVFSSSVNDSVDNGFLYTLFCAPIAPYWFLYTLFLLFVISPIIKSKGDAIIRIAIGICLYMLASYQLTMAVPEVIFNIVNSICNNYIWFLLGMTISYFNAEKHFKAWYILFFAIFLVARLFAVYKMIDIGGFGIVLTALACVGTTGFLFSLYKSNNQTKIFGILAKYNMPIFLMHTIFASACRAVLLKAGVTSLIIHIIVGVVASFVLPIIAGFVMQKIKLDILYQPTKYIKIK